MKIPDGIMKALKDDLLGKTGKQTSMLYLSQILALILGVIIGIINTRVLGPIGYGILAFFLAITSFIVLFFRFGFFSASELLIARAKEKRKERELTGAAVILALVIGISYSFFVLALSFFVDQIFNTNVGWILRITSFMLIVMPFNFLIPQVGRGMNKIGNLSLFNVIPKVVYISGALMLMKFIQIETFHFILLSVLSTIIAVVAITLLFRPLFIHIKENLRQIRAKTKEYGFHLYLGQIADQATYQLDRIFITFFVGTLAVGYYSLAALITLPMIWLPQALSTSLFKRFVEMERIPKKIFYYSLIWLAVCVVGLAVFGEFIVVHLFTNEFIPAVPLILPLAVAAFFQGMYQPYSFLAAKGKGKWIRNVAYAEAISNIIGNILLIYYFGAFGAAVASAISKFVHWAMLRRYYWIFVNVGD